MFARIKNVLRGYVLTYGVANRGAALALASPGDCAVTEVDDSQNQLTAWEQDRAATLREADECEQLGLQHLTRAALLRLVVRFEEEGLFVVAQELRQRADA